MPIAALPMYDWPEVTAATDRLWSAICGRFQERGLSAPAALSRGGDPYALWKSPDLLLAQTCGYPFSTELAGKVALVGTPAYAIGCRPGRYCSVIVVRREHSDLSVAELSALTMAMNGRDSQSGYHAPRRMFRHAGLPEPDRILQTGGHRNSIRAVASGKADFAAIDKVTWQLAMRHEPAASTLAAIAETRETPALPLITALAHAGDAGRIFDCVRGAIYDLDKDSRAALMIEDLIASTPQDYAALAAD